jgi:hypothetical protein
MIKKCNKCGVEKELSKFYKQTHGKFGVDSYCKECRKEANRKSYNPEVKKQYHDSHKLEHNQQRMLKLYGVTLEQYQLMFQEQNGVCAICGQPETAIYKRNGNVAIKNLSIDHVHKTGKVRSLLCYRCNYILALVNDNFKITQQATDYLKKHQDT